MTPADATTVRPVATAVAVVGGGPAGLMAAERLSAAGIPVDLYDAMPSVGRKFLLAGKGGLYCEDCDVAQLTQPGTSRTSGVDPHAVDADAARRLWDVSVEASGLNAF